VIKVSHYKRNLYAVVRYGNNVEWAKFCPLGFIWSPVFEYETCLFGKDQAQDICNMLKAREVRHEEKSKRVLEA